jgi:hypothetical protein
VSVVSFDTPTQPELSTRAAVGHGLFLHPSPCFQRAWRAKTPLACWETLAQVRRSVYAKNSREQKSPDVAVAVLCRAYLAILEHAS